jgi:nucleoside-diphosphate-sugar epimerase
MKYLITGSSGFWGYNLVEYILKKDKNSDITCIYNSNNKHLNKFNVKSIQCSLEIESETSKLLDDYDCVIHLASIVKHTHKNSEKNIDINVLGCKNILELCKNIQNKYNKKINLVIASTVGTVACFDDNNMESNELSEYSKKSLKFPYYNSKITMEKMANKYADEYSFKLSIIRPPIIYGPNDYKGRATHLIKKFIKSNVVLFGSGNIPFCDVRDLCRFTFEIIKKEDSNRVYNIDGCRWNMQKFYEVLEEVSGEKKIKIWVPYILGYYLVPILNKCFKLPDIVEVEMGNSYWNSTSLYSKDFDWSDPRKTLQDTILWTKSNL